MLAPRGAAPAVADRRLEKTCELAREIDRDARVHRALLVEESLRAGEAEDAFVPDVGMDVEALAAVEAKAYESLRRDVVAGQRQRHVERPPVERKEQLAAVGVVVRVPQHHAPRRLAVVGARRLWWLGVAEDVVAVDGVVAAVEDVALPLADEDAFGGAALVAGVGVDRPRSALRPANDLDLAFGGIVDEAAVALQGRRGGVDDRHDDSPQPGRQVRSMVVDRRPGHRGPGASSDSTTAARRGSRPASRGCRP